MKKMKKSNNSLLYDGLTPCSHYHIASSHSIASIKQNHNKTISKKKENDENALESKI